MAHVPYDRVLWRDIAWDDVFEGKTNASCYYMRAGLIRKDLLPLYAGEDAPATVVVANAATLHDALESRPAGSLWVLKKAAGSNASGIMFFRGGASAEAIDMTVSAAFSNYKSIAADGSADSGTVSAPKSKASPTWVLQAYVIPATVRSRKFHIRLPVLAIGTLTVLMHSNCRVICATLPWSESHDTQDTFVHVTNLNVNCKHPDYDAWDQNFSLWALPPDVSVSVWSAMRLIVARLFRRVSAVRRHFFTLPNCFELFGLDFTVASDGQVFLLEVNPDPGLSMFHVMPPSGTVIPGSMPFELAGSASIRAALAASEEGDLVTVPAIAAAVALPEGHLSVPNPPIDPFTTTIEEFSRLGFQPVLQLDSLPA